MNSSSQNSQFSKDSYWYPQTIEIPTTKKLIIKDSQKDTIDNKFYEYIAHRIETIALELDDGNKLNEIYHSLADELFDIANELLIHL